MRAIFDILSKKRRQKELEKKIEEQDFWNNPKESAGVLEELSGIREEIERIEHMVKNVSDLALLAAEVSKEGKKMHSPEQNTSGAQSIEKELAAEIKKAEREISAEETTLFLGGPYDKGSAIITIYSGAGGIDAQDWAGMLLRMYQRHAAHKGYKAALISQSFGEGKGIKEAVLEVAGKYAYGYLKHENGVHRLVRISPYSAQKLRHTSFALVEVLPQLSKDSQEIIVTPDDIEVQTFRSSGPGGQHVNKTESAVRIRHISTGIVVESQTERHQGTNKSQAMKLLLAKLLARKIKEEKEKKDMLKGEFVSAEWGNQIRSYVLHPYKMVKDHRTGVETSDVEGVLNGDLDEFIEAEVTRAA